jgi:photosystem II stability/assembly factor-like uncharacterized protein
MFKIKLSFITLLLISSASVYSQSGWFVQPSGITENLYSIFFINPSTGWACGNNGKILSTVNGGYNWNERTSNTDNNLFSIFFLNQNTGWVCGGKNYSAELPAYQDCILKTTNGGTIWQTIYNQVPAYPVVFTDIYFSDANNGMVIGSQGLSLVSYGVIMKTSNGGQGWTSFIVDSLARTSLAFVNNLTGYLACSYYIDYHDLFTYNSYVFKTTNFGINWNPVYSVNNKSITVLSCPDVNNVFGGGMSITSTGIIYKTQNGGSNWQEVNPDSSGEIISVSAPSFNFVWATTYNKKILASTNGGLNWYFQINPVDAILNNLFFADNLTGWAVGNSGTILKTTTGGVVGIKPDLQPVSFSLSQNYPNPFNPATKIKFQAPLSPPEGGKQEVSLIIYDVLGKEVAVIFSSPWGRIGGATYEAEWDASNYPSGVYFYKLTAGDYADTKKMVLIK